VTANRRNYYRPACIRFALGVLAYLARSQRCSKLVAGDDVSLRYRAPNVDWKKYSRVFVSPVLSYGGEDRKIPAQDSQFRANYLHEAFEQQFAAKGYATNSEDSASDRIVSWMEDAARTPAELEGMLRGITTVFKSYLRRRDNKVLTTRCAFCRKGQDDVRFLVAASEAAICDECVHIAVEVIEERETPKAPNPGGRGAKSFWLAESVGNDAGDF